MTIGTKTHIDLGTGRGGWTAAFQDADGWRSVGLDTRGDLPPLHPVDELWVGPTDSEPTQASLAVATDGGTQTDTATEVDN